MPAAAETPGTPPMFRDGSSVLSMPARPRSSRAVSGAVHLIAT